MPSVFQRALTRLGIAGGRKDEPPIINDGAGNLPSIRIIRGPYQVPARTSGYYYGGAGGIGSYTGAVDYGTQAQQGYARNSDVYACVTLIAEAASQVKWWDGGGDSKALRTRDVLYSAIGGDLKSFYGMASADARALKAVTNPTASIAALILSGGAKFINEWMSSILISGDAFIEVEPVAEGSERIKALHLLRPDRVRAKRRTSGDYQDEKSVVEEWTVFAYGKPRPVPVGNMVHSKLYNPLDDVMGMAPLDAAMINVLLHNEGIANIRRVLQTGSVPGWVELDRDTEWNDEQITALKEKIAASRRGEGELTLQNALWHERGVKPGEAGFADAQVLSKRDIASVYHVDPVLIGDMQGRTYATYRESRRGLYMEAVIPLLTMFRDDWNHTIGARLNSPLDFDRDSFDAITAAREEATDRVVKLWQSGLIDRSEARNDLQYDPVPGDDGVFYAPASFIPMDGRTGPGGES